MNKKGFSLIELMIAVSILAVGIVGILKSFLSVSSTLDSLDNRLTAISFLDSKLASLTEGIYEKESGKLEAYAESTMIRERKAVFQLEIDQFDTECCKDIINQARLSVTWQEGKKSQNEEIVLLAESKR